MSAKLLLAGARGNDPDHCSGMPARLANRRKAVSCLATAIRNESGASSHEAYKARQHERVRMRLFRDKDDPLPPD